MADFEDIKAKYPLGGRPKAFNSPEEMLEKMYAFLETQEKRTIEVSTKDGVKELTNPGPITIEGFCCFAGITKTTFYDYARKPKFKAIAQQFRQIVEKYLVEQCLEGKAGNKADFVLKNAFDEYWKEKSSVDMNGTIKGFNIGFSGGAEQAKPVEKRDDEQ